MKIIIKTEKIKLTPALEENIKEKIGSLEKFVEVLQEDEDAYFNQRKARAEACF